MPPGEPVPEAAACGACGCTADGPYYRVRHPSKGERVVCAAHARRVPDARADGGTKGAASIASGSTGETHATLGVVEASGVREHPRHGAPKPMDASKPTPSEGESADGVSRSERVELAHALGIMDSVRDGLPTHRDDPSRADLLEEVREARAELAVIEKILSDCET